MTHPAILQWCCIAFSGGSLRYLKEWLSLSFFQVSSIKQGLYENSRNPLWELTLDWQNAGER
jgi:hypothetical protein